MSFCCKVCDRSKSCGVDCGSCVDEMPYVCPGCHAVGDERCVPGCIDDAIRREREEALMSGDYDRFEDDEDER